MVLSICIVNWNTRKYLGECLASIYQHPPRGAELEVIVVDNDSDDGSADMVAKEYSQVLLIRNDRNRGYAEGNNQAMEIARGDFILLLNPDVVIPKDALTRALVFMRSNPHAGAMGCRLLSVDGSTQRSLRSFPDPGPLLWEYLGFSKLFPKSRYFGRYRMTYFDYDRQDEVDQPMGTFLMLTRATVKDVGLMDPDFPIFFNEVDWCYRAKREKGYRIFYTPDVAITHYGGASTSQIKPRMIKESHRSLLRFYKKHYQNRMPKLLYLMMRDAVLWNERRILRKAAKQSAVAQKAVE